MRRTATRLHRGAWIAGAAAALLGAPRAAGAQDTPPAPWYEGVEAHVFVGTSWSYNLNRPDSRKNTLRVFDFDDNSIKIDVVEFSMQKTTPTMGDAGFRFDVCVGGSIPRVTASAGLFGGQTGNAQDIDLQQGFVTWNAPVGGGLHLDAGKFVTPFGYEVIEGWDGYNDNATRSFLFGYGVPFTHVGLRANLGLGHGVAGTLMVVNGWDVATDNNRGKSVGGQLAYVPSERFSTYATFMVGPERNHNDSDLRQAYGLTALWKVTPVVSVGAEVLYGREAAGSGSASYAWDGVAAYARVALGDRWSLAARAEAFDDRDGFRTGNAQTLVEGTLTPEVRLGERARLRADFRVDHSDRSVFESAGGSEQTQPTVLLAALYAF